MIEWLETAWERWASSTDRDSSFEGAAAEGGVVPALVPGNGLNRDPCNRPGDSVACQTAYYAVDKWAPIFGALRFDRFCTGFVCMRRMEVHSNAMEIRACNK